MFCQPLNTQILRNMLVNVRKDGVHLFMMASGRFMPGQVMVAVSQKNTV